MPLPKPPTCHGCPFNTLSRWFTPDGYVEGAEVLVLSQNPGEDEEQGRRLTHYDMDGRRSYEPCQPSPLTGTTGYDLTRKYLPLAGLERGKDVSLANSIRCRPDGRNDLPPVTDKALRQAVEHCQFHHYKPPASTRLVIAEGAYALFASTGEDGTESPGHKINRGVEGWRGWLLPWNPPPRARVTFNDVWVPSSTPSSSPWVLPTYHLAYLYRAPWYTPVSQRDWSKVQAILQGKWPEPFPEIHPLPPETWPRRSAFDTEFYPGADGTDQLVRYSLAWRGRQGEPYLHVVEADNLVQPVTIPPEIVTVFHQVESDVGHLRGLLNPGTKVSIEDTMYLHAVLWPDLDHTLDFLGSLYARTNRWKHLLRTNPRVYSGGDALGTWDTYVPLAAELERDPSVRKVYYEYQLPLARIIHRARSFGLRVVPSRVEQALESMGGSQDDATQLAQAHCGWPINLGSSQQVARELYEVEGVHLNPITGRVRR